ncbi:hypothetical protein ACHAXA_003845 [Cyclostephanos tholiformis]|uniref:Endonuclease n=1 Tax=Cyclostephanos tholiformis TaxID=382380 RepID=A0ABD3R7K7_9STRA
MPPVPRWLTHAASFCLGAAVATAASASALVGAHYGQGRKMAASEIDAPADDDGASGVDFRANVKCTNSTTTTKKNGTNPMHEMLPSPPVRIYIPNDDLAIAYDSRTRNPLYVIERLVPTPPVGSDARHRDRAACPSSRRRDGMRFREDKSLSPYHRSRNSHYRGSGYDRGHLAPAADFPASMVGYDDDDDDDDDDDVGGGGKSDTIDVRIRNRMDDTFALTNISPQVPKFNRSIWLRQEFVRGEAGMMRGRGANTYDRDRRRGETTWVITGPLWLPKYYHRATPPAIGVTMSSAIDEDEDDDDDDVGVGVGRGGMGIGRPPTLVAVPTHFFKVVVVVHDEVSGNDETSSSGTSSGGRNGVDSNVMTTKTSLRRFAAFVLPNSDLVGDDNNDDATQRGIRLADHVVRLTDLEAATGMEFFPTLFGKYVDDGTDAIPVRKEIADALTDEIIRLRGSKKRVVAGRAMMGGVGGGSRSAIDYHQDDGALVPLSNIDEGSSGGDTGRRRRMRRVLRDNSPIPFRHICWNNDGCFKFLRV